MTPLFHDIYSVIQALASPNILVVGDEDVAQHLKSWVNDSTLNLDIHRANDWLTSEQTERYDLGLILFALESLEKTKANELLGRIRNLSTNHLLIAHQTRSGETFREHHTWQDTDFFAFGMTQLKAYPETQQQLFEYNIHSYKNVPSWLNSDFWANPNMWDKHRW